MRCCHTVEDVADIRLCSAGQLPVWKQTEAFPVWIQFGFPYTDFACYACFLTFIGRFGLIHRFFALQSPCYSKVFSFICCSLWSCFLSRRQLSLSVPVSACPQFCFTWNKGWVLTWIRGMIGNFDRNFSYESIVLSRSYISSKDRQGCISLVSESNWKTKIKWCFCQKAGGLKTGIAPPEAVGMKREDRVVASKIQRNYRDGDGYYFLES